VPADQGPPSHEVLVALVASLRQELADALGALGETRAELGRERVAELEARLNQTPRNSSKPPSAEGLGKPPPRSLRKKSGRVGGVRAGGAPHGRGAEGRLAARQLYEAADVVVQGAAVQAYVEDIDQEPPVRLMVGGIYAALDAAGIVSSADLRASARRDSEAFLGFVSGSA
jgi:hypothetical protein